MKKAAIIMFFVAVINFGVMMILRSQELASCSGAECSFAGVPQGLSTLLISFPLLALSGLFALVSHVKSKEHPELIKKINIWSVIVWVVGLSLITSVIIPILI